MKKSKSKIVKKLGKKLGFKVIDVKLSDIPEEDAVLRRMIPFYVDIRRENENTN